VVCEQQNPLARLATVDKLLNTQTLTGHSRGRWRQAKKTTTMKHFISLILLGLFLCNIGFACDCAIFKRDSAVKVGLQYSDIIFYGDLISTDTINMTYKFKILELYKGNFTKDTIAGCVKTSCSIMPMINGLWIVYANLNEDSTIRISMCGPSVPLQKTEGLVPPPPPPVLIGHYDKTIEPLKVKIHILEQRVKGLSYWIYDLEKLRTYKREHTIVNKAVNYKSYLIFLLIGLNLALILIILIKRK
jgi:hypothetical protein